MQRFDHRELRRFLVDLDSRLTASKRITLIGGGALALGYGVANVTNDLDCFDSRLGPIEHHIDDARTASGLDVMMVEVPMAQLPIGYEDRLRRVLHELVHLEVFVVDPYDLACSKLLRGNAHDREHLIALHAIEPFAQDRLVATYCEFLETFVGDPTEPRWNLIHLVDEIWGELDAATLRATINAR